MTDHPVFARLYHHVISWAQPPAFVQLRRRLTGLARGVVAEVGAGDGVNLPLYRASVTRVLAVEPDRYMRRYLAEMARQVPRTVDVMEGEAEAVPLEDASVDTVLFSLVLCSVRDPSQAVREARRVLRPGGRLLLLEHVASDRPGWRRVQRALDPLWGAVSGGCHLDRDTLKVVAENGFAPTVLERWGDSFQPVVLAEAIRPEHG